MNIKFQLTRLLLYTIFILAVIQITSCKKVEPASVAIVTPSPPPPPPPPPQSTTKQNNHIPVY